MKLKWLITLAFISSAQTVFANDNSEKMADDAEWTVGISGGVAIIEGSNSQKFGGLSISKDIGDSHIGLSVTHTDSGTVPGLINAVPASTTEFTLSAGASFDALNADGYFSYGKRNFDTEALRNNGRAINIDSDGNVIGAGLSLSYDIILNDQTFLTPIIGVDYNKLDIARVATGPTGNQIVLEDKEDGVTGSFGAALQLLFGKDDTHLASLLANLVTTSNTTSFNPGNAPTSVARVLALRNEPGQKDSWGEIGGSLSFGVSKNLRWDVSIVQTVGFLNSDATSLSTGLRHSF